METLLGQTRVSLYKKTDEEIKQLQRSLGRYLDTPQEAEAKRLARWIRDEIDRRCSYGF